MASPQSFAPSRVPWQGMAVGPLLFGALMDGDQPALVFVFIGVFQALAIATAVGVGGKTRAVALQKA